MRRFNETPDAIERLNEDPRLPKLTRSRLFAALGAMAFMLTVSPEADADESIPFCHDLPGHSAPPEARKTWLEGKEPGTVHCIVDGDTFDVRLEKHDGRLIRIRLWGVDCPESSMNRKCMKRGHGRCRQEIQQGKKASQKVQKLLGNGEVVLEPPYANNGNRKLSYMKKKKGQIDVGRALIKSCMCREGYKHKRKKQYQKAARRCGRR